ncbi:MAG: hypothetical protein Q8L89_05110 [Gammaproteobacteria bacterium]|nr:hypothetical protein [Gammaproteobacteria bacterium]
MYDIYYNQALSKFNPVLMAGMLAMHSLPVIAQPDMEEQCSKSILDAAYRASTNSATYSHLSSIFTGKYSYATAKFSQPWMTSELADFLLRSSQVSLEGLDYLLVAIHDTYGDVQIDTVMHTDPEEGWIKPVFIVHSGIEDFDNLMDIEDSFFVKATSDPTLRAILPFVVVSQA